MKTNEPTEEEEDEANSQAKASFKDCIGDGLYAQFDGHHIILTAERVLSIDPPKVIPQVVYLDPYVVKAFASFARRCGYGELLKEP